MFWERKILSINQKLEMKLHKGRHVTKAESGRPLGLLLQIISQVVSAKKGKGFEKEIQVLSVNARMITERNSLTADSEKVLWWGRSQSSHGIHSL